MLSTIVVVSVAFGEGMVLYVGRGCHHVHFVFCCVAIDAGKKHFNSLVLAVQVGVLKHGSVVKLRIELV